MNKTTLTKVTTVFLCLLSFSRGSGAAVVDPEGHWKTAATRHFNIHYEVSDEAAVSPLVQKADVLFNRLCPHFKSCPEKRITVVVTDQHDDANGLATVIPYPYIWLRLVPPSIDSSLGDYEDWVEQLFIHELTHIIHIADTGWPAKPFRLLFGNLVAPNGVTPGWVLEGLATYYESVMTGEGRGNDSFTDMLIRTDILQNRFLKLDQMIGHQIDWPQWMSQYHYGAAFWKFLADRYGEEKISDFSHRTGSSLLLYALNHQSKKSFGKSFYVLWREWKASLEHNYADVKKTVMANGLEEGKPFLLPQKGGSFLKPIFLPKTRKLVYLATSIHHRPELRLRDVTTGTEKSFLKDRRLRSFQANADETHLIVSYSSPYKTYQDINDLYEVDLKTLHSKVITRGNRLRDAVYSPDGRSWIAVQDGDGQAKLVWKDKDEKNKEWKTLLSADQLDQPVFLPDGRSVVVSRLQKGQRDLWLVTLDGSSQPAASWGKRLTNDRALEREVVVGPSENSIFYSSDKSGIANIYSLPLGGGDATRLTNVLTGAFSPTLMTSAGEDPKLGFQYYNGRGYELRSVDIPRHHIASSSDEDLDVIPHQKNDATILALPGEPEELSPLKIKSEDYRPFKGLFVPRYMMPNLAVIDGAVFLSLMVNNFDPLQRHFWHVEGDYRSDNQFLGYGAGYSYSRYRMPIHVNFQEYSVNYGNVFGFGTDYFEARRRGSLGTGIRFGKQSLGASYFFENRRVDSGLPAGTTLSTLGNYAGVNLRYGVSSKKGTLAGISPESGGEFSANLQLTDSALGSASSLEQQVVWGDGRAYFKVPGTKHHVLALRGEGGVALGDPLLQGNFSLGGSIGEGLFTGTSTRTFTLRGLPLGTFSRDRAWVASAEYRLPLYYPQRGLGTLPFYLNTMHLAFFTDVGDAFNRGNPSFRPLVGVGAELRGDFVIGYHLPIVGRLGYGIIMTHRNRLGSIQDPLTGFEARHGVVVLELGTSY